MHSRTAGLTHCRVFLWLLLGGWTGAAWAVESTGSPVGATSSVAVAKAGDLLHYFDIPALPLATALDRFADVSGRSVLFPGTLLAERHSSSIQGRYTTKVALRRMLEGSGLEVEEISSGKVTALLLKPVAKQPSVATAPLPEPSALGGYENLVQARIWDAICANPDTATDSYRALLRFSVDAAGRLDQPRLLSSTGDRRRDAALLGALRRVRLDRAPPSEMQQPVTMLILPGQAGGPVCATGGPLS